LELRVIAHSEIGLVRKNNQDSGYASPTMLMVADGMGGAAAGDLASAVAIDEFSRLDGEFAPGDDLLGLLAGAIDRADQRLSSLIDRDYGLDGMGTTVCGGVFDGQRLGVVHLGDSRGYLLREGYMLRLTHDHSYVQSLIDEGKLHEDDVFTHPHRSLLLKVLNGQGNPTPDYFFEDLVAGDRVMFCSDGLCGMVTDSAIAPRLASASRHLALTELVAAAHAAGGQDNITVIIADVVDVDAEAALAEEDTAILSAPVARAGSGRAVGALLDEGESSAGAEDRQSRDEAASTDERGDAATSTSPASPSEAHGRFAEDDATGEEETVALRRRDNGALLRRRPQPIVEVDGVIHRGGVVIGAAFDLGVGSDEPDDALPALDDVDDTIISSRFDDTAPMPVLSDDIAGWDPAPGEPTDSADEATIAEADDEPTLPESTPSPVSSPGDRGDRGEPIVAAQEPPSPAGPADASPSVATKPDLARARTLSRPAADAATRPSPAVSSDTPVADTDAEIVEDAEHERYQPGDRRSHHTILIVVVLFVSLILVAGWCVYAYGKTQFYVGSDSGNVTVFQGVRGDLFGRPLNRIEERTDISVTDLPIGLRDQLVDGIVISSGGLTQAEETVAEIRQKSVECLDRRHTREEAEAAARAAAQAAADALTAANPGVPPASPSPVPTTSPPDGC
jgi:serine/threonine protein phosphatase PrpC